jgi:hypothetical protein
VAENVGFYTGALLEHHPPMAGSFGPEDGRPAAVRALNRVTIPAK